MARTWRLIIVAVSLLIMGTRAMADEPIKISVSRLAFPGAVTALLDVMIEKGLDKRHGIELEVKNYSTISAFYGATSTGEVDMSTVGPWGLQRIRTQGAKVQGVFTFVSIASLGVITGDPAIKTIQDLKGKSLAADMGSAEYLLLAMYAKSQGVEFGKDVTVTQAGPPVAKVMLEANRVDAAMSWETNVTLLLKDNPKFRRFIGGDTAWAGLVGSDKLEGWDVIITMHEDALKKHPEAIPRLLAMWQDAVQFIQTNTDEAEAIDFKTVKLPLGVLGDALKSKRLVYDIQPIWGPQKDGIWESFKLGLKYGYLKEMPDKNILYTP